jgi:predicted GNAT family acetyltransferase
MAWKPPRSALIRVALATPKKTAIIAAPIAKARQKLSTSFAVAVIRSAATAPEQRGRCSILEKWICNWMEN